MVKDRLSVCIILATLLATTGARGQTAIKGFEIIEPRSFGYLIGDLLQRRVHLALNAPYRVVEDSLPSAGRINLWLELRPPVMNVDSDGDSTDYRITLTYQLLNVSEDRQPVVIPAHNLAFTDGKQTLSVAIPAWGFTAAPVTPPGTGLTQLQPEQAPPPIPLTTYLLRLGLAVAVLVVALAGLAYLHWTLPFVARSNGPFARAYRQLKKRSRNPAGAVDRDALRCLHQAFNQTAGRALFAENLESFFAQHARYAALRAPIEDFFARSPGPLF